MHRLLFVSVLMTILAFVPCVQAQTAAPAGARSKAGQTDQPKPETTRPDRPRQERPRAQQRTRNDQSPRTPKPGDTQNASPQPDTIPARVIPVPMEDFAAEPDLLAPAEPVASNPDGPSACQVRIADRIAVIASLPALSGPGDCGAEDVVRLEAIIQPDKSRVAVSPPATMRCTMAEALATWVREDLTATVAMLGAPPRSLDNYASYDCRGRNRVPGAKISEHGLANAIDVRGVHLNNGRFAEFTDRNLDREFREAVRKSVCARFTTILGPGSDGYHESHIHMDLAQRRGGYRLCQWNVLDPINDIPLPRPRPKEAS